MFNNLAAEQRRKGKTNQDMADVLNVSRVTYERKKRRGNFYVSEAKKLCTYFKCQFDYLFSEEEAKCD